MGFFPEITTDPFKAERYSLIRRSFYIGGVTAFSLCMPTVFVLLGLEGGLVDLVSRSLLSMAELCATLYLGAGVLDRSKVLDKLGDGFASKRGATVVITPPAQEDNR